MSDAPMTPSELVDYILGDESDYEDCTEALTDYADAIRQQAQAEALEQAETLCRDKAHELYCLTKTNLADEWEEAANEISSMSPLPHYRERIVAQARLEEAKLWNSIRLTAVNLPGQAQLEAAARLAELARLAAADAEKPAEGA